VSRFDLYQTVEDLSNAMVKCRCNGLGYVYVDVPLGHRFFGKAVPCVCRRDEELARRAKSLRSRSGLGESARLQWTFHSFEPAKAIPTEGVKTEDYLRKAKWRCQKFARIPEGWLMLLGGVGTGKTHLAVATLNELLNNGFPAFFATVPGLLDQLRAGYNDGTYDELWTWIRQVRVLILDDLGAHHATDWAAERMYELVNYRYANLLPMIVTTNQIPEGPEAHSRLWSRLCDGMNTKDGLVSVLPMPAEDFRRRGIVKH